VSRRPCPREGGGCGTASTRAWSNLLATRQIAHRRQHGELATCISLMYASDYPHSDARKKLLWDNASRFFKQT